MARRFGTIREEQREGRRPRVYIEVWVEGKRHRISSIHIGNGRKIRLGSREVAEQFLEELRAEIRSGRSAAQVVAYHTCTDTFAAAWGRFSAAKARQGQDSPDRQLSAQRLDEIRSAPRRGHMAPLEGVSIHTINYGVLEDWRDGLFSDGKLSARSIQHLITDVGTCLRWLVRRGDLHTMPELPTVAVPEYAPTIPTPAAQDRLLAAIPWDLRGIFLVRGLMGLRPSEARRARVSDWDWERHLLVVRGKGWRVRYLPADGEVNRWVEAHVDPASRLRDAQAPPSPLFRNPRAWGEGCGWTKASEARVWRAACKKVGMRFQPNEGLRHAFATHAVNRDVPMEKLRYFMGHSDEKTTRRYAKLAGERLVDVPRNRLRVVQGDE